MKKRRPVQPRILPPVGENLAGAQELAAAKARGDRYIVGTTDEGAFGIFEVAPPYRWSVAKLVEAKPGLTWSGVHDLVARMNAGLPLSKERKGIGNKPRTAAPAAQWAELLLRLPNTRADLEAAKADGRKLSADYVDALMRTVWASVLDQMDDVHAPIPVRVRARKAARARLWTPPPAKPDSVLRQLKRAFGVTPADGRNEHRANKRTR